MAHLAKKTMTDTQANEAPLGHEPRWLMPALDVALILLAWVLGYIMRYDWQIFRPVYDPSSADFVPYIPYMLIYTVLLLIIYHNNGLYRTVHGRSWLADVGLIGNGITNAAVILLALYFSLQPLVTSRLMLVYVAVLTLAFLGSSRGVRRIVLAYLRSKGIGVQRVVIVGMGDVGQAVLRTLVSRSELGYKVVGYLDDDPQRGTVDLGRVSGLGKLDNLESVLLAHGIDQVFITLRWADYNTILDVSRTARHAGAKVRVVPDIFQLNMRQVQVEALDGIPLLNIGEEPELKGANRLLKRALDIVLTLLGLPIWGLLFLLVAIAIKLDDGGDILYRHERVGENGRRFFMYKFRSMIPEADRLRQQVVTDSAQDPKRPKMVDDPRLTRVGKFIRRTSLDEVPNFLNVLKGEMSLVGPRPPMPDEVALYDDWHKQRLRTIPGITGLWQISGRSEVPFDEMCLMDIYYIENWSLKYDLQILLLTLPRVLLRQGAY